jgi:hypothetical protein
MKKRYILFIDFKQAFVSVHLGILVRMLIDKGVSKEIINTLIKLMNSSKISMDLIRTVNVNSGTGQDKCCSPLLFDIFIDDLLDGLDEYCYAVLAFADDIAIECEDEEKLRAAMIFFNRWSKANHIEVNYDKSGIIVTKDDGLTPAKIMVSGSSKLQILRYTT